MGITNSVKLLNDLTTVVIAGIKVGSAARTGNYFQVAIQATSLIPLLEPLVADARASLPELESLTAAETADLAQAALNAIKQIALSA